jgi:Secretion system C-terminal sorting domain
MYLIIFLIQPLMKFYQQKTSFLFVISMVILVNVSAQSISILKDIIPNKDNGVPTSGASMAKLSNKLFFTSDSLFPNYKLLYSTDGTPENTVQVLSSAIVRDVKNLTATESLLFFEGKNSSSGLFVSNGTVAGTKLVKKFDNTNLLYFHKFDNNRVLFTAEAKDTTLWISDGTEAGTIKLANYRMNEYVKFSSYGTLKLAYEKSTNNVKMTPFITDGTVAGTKLVKDYIKPLYTFSDIISAVGANDRLFITGRTTPNGQYIDIVSDGTANGTSTITVYGGEIKSAFKIDNLYYVFTGSGLSVFNSLTKTTTELSSLVDFFAEPIAHLGKIYFIRNEEIYSTSGTIASTKRLAKQNIGNFNFEPLLFAHKNFIYFNNLSNALSTEGNLLFRYNLTDSTETKITNLYPFGSFINPLITDINDVVLFTKITTTEGHEWWKINKASTPTTETYQIEALSVYPNPTSDFLVLPSLKTMGNASFNLFDMTGKSVLNSSLDITTDNKIAISHLQQGNYIVIVKTVNKLYKAKIQILR